MASIGPSPAAPYDCDAGITGAQAANPWIYVHIRLNSRRGLGLPSLPVLGVQKLRQRGLNGILRNSEGIPRHLIWPFWWP